MQKIRKKYLPKDDKKSLAHTLKSSKPLSKLSEKEKPISMDRVSTPKGKSKLQIKDRPLSHKNDFALNRCRLCYHRDSDLQHMTYHILIGGVIIITVILIVLSIGSINNSSLMDEVALG